MQEACKSGTVAYKVVWVAAEAVTGGDDWQVKDPLAVTAGLGQEPSAFGRVTMRNSPTVVGQRDTSMFLQSGLFYQGVIPGAAFVAG